MQAAAANWCGRCVSLRLQLFADAVRHDFAPVDFRACDRQLATQRFERGIRHVLVVFRN